LSAGARGAGQHGARPHASGIALGLENLLQEVGIARVLARRRALRDPTIEIRQGAKPQLLGQRHDAIVLEPARVVSSA
jgi:hypothetical protein